MVEVRNLKKRYGKFVALNDMSFNIGEGELYGFVGPNGAGKTTTMQIMAGLLQADSGQVYVNGENITKHPKAIKKIVAYMPDFFGVYDNLKVSEYMDFFSGIYGIPAKERKKIYRQKLEIVNLEERENDYVDGLSRGLKQKLCLARCLLCEPKLLILDEPASGMDPIARLEFKKILQQLSAEGKTILISSHILSELSEFCTNVGIVKQGKMLVSGAMDEIMTKFNQANPILIQCVLGQEEMVAFLKRNPMVETISIHGAKVYIGFRGTPMEEADLLQQIIRQGVLVSGYGRVEGNLESLFLQLSGDSNQEP